MCYTDIMKSQENTTGFGIETEAEILAETLSQIKKVLPETFKLEIERQKENTPPFKADAIIDVTRGNQQVFQLAAEVKKTIDSSGLLKVINLVQTQLRQIADPLVVARYISVPAQEELKKLAISFADATGNIYISIPEQPMFISNRGSDRDPWRKAGRPKSVLTGISTELVIRALIELPEPYKTAELIEKSGAARGSVYWILDSLEEAGYVSRNEKGVIQFVRWKQLLEAWATESDFYKTNRTAFYIAPRGLDRLLDDLRGLNPADYVATGTIASRAYKDTAGLYTAMIYSANEPEIANKLGLRETDRGANVILAHPNADLRNLRSSDFEGLRVATAPQTYRDLMWGPGRNPEEAKNLLKWMESNVDIWRKKC